MKTITKLFTIITLCLCCFINAQVPNDACDDATTIAIGDFPFAETLDATSANDDGFVDVCTDEMNNGVWYTFTADSNSTMAVTLTSLGAWDPQIGVFTGSCSTMYCVGPVDQNDQGENESLLVEIVSGTTYWVNIGQRSSSSDNPEGLFTLDMEILSEAVDNDVCEDAKTIDMGSLPFNEILDARTATDDGFINDCTDGMNDGAWYEFTPLANGKIEISLSDLGVWDAQIGIYTGDCTSLECLDTVDEGDSGEDESLTIDVTSGTMYWINIGQRSSSSDNPEGLFTINMDFMAAPANDACDDATTIAIEDFPYTETLDATFASNDGFVDVCANEMNDGVWYTFTADSENTMSITLSSVGDWDPQIGVFSGGDCTSLVCVGTIDDAFTGGNESISFVMTSGTTYWVNIGQGSSGTDHPEGLFTLDMEILSEVIDNDVCEDARTIDMESLPFNETLDARTAAADGFVDVCTDEMNNGVWYEFTPLVNGKIVIDLTDLGVWDAQIGLFTGDCSSLTCVDTVDEGDSGEDESLSVDVTSGTMYWINIGQRSSSSDNSEGLFTINVELLLAPDNDACVDATTIDIGSFPYTEIVDATSAADNGIISACSNGMNNGIWYTFTADSDNTMVIDLSSVGDWNPQIGVYTGSCSMIECVDTVDLNGDGENESLSVTMVSGTTYWVNIGENSSSTDNPEGLFTINMEILTSTVENDACDDATTIGSLPFTEIVDARPAAADGFVDVCTDEMNDGVWYQFTSSINSEVTINLTDLGVWDAQIGVFTGDCSSLTCVDTVDEGGSGGNESLSFDVTIGTSYWINIGQRSSSSDYPEGEFTIEIVESSLNLTQNIFENFSLYPTLVKNHLVFDSQEKISKITIFNIIGQEQLFIQPETNLYDLDVSKLSSGLYIVKVQIGDITGTYKIIKE